jgi:hypothetical protein
MARTYKDFEKSRFHQKYPRKSNGEALVGATTPINQNCSWGNFFLERWRMAEMKAGRDPQKSMEVAGEIGTLTHYLIECWLKEEEADTSEYGGKFIDEAYRNLIGFQKWSTRMQFKAHKIEYGVASEIYPYGGQIDLICEAQGEMFLGDIKTSKGVGYPKQEMQVVAYAKAYEEEAGVFLPQAFLHVYQGRCTIHWIDEDRVPLLWEAFKTFLKAEQLRKQLGA